MTKQEFMSKLSDELKRRGVADADDILGNTSSISRLSWPTAAQRRRSPRVWAIRPGWPRSSRTAAKEKRAAARG